MATPTAKQVKSRLAFLPLFTGCQLRDGVMGYRRPATGICRIAGMSRVAQASSMAGS